MIMTPARLEMTNFETDFNNFRKLVEENGSDVKIGYALCCVRHCLSDYRLKCGDTLDFYKKSVLVYKLMLQHKRRPMIERKYKIDQILAKEIPDTENKYKELAENERKCNHHKREAAHKAIK